MPSCENKVCKDNKICNPNTGRCNKPKKRQYHVQIKYALLEKYAIHKQLDVKK
jgi:hypothetical protein